MVGTIRILLDSLAVDGTPPSRWRANLYRIDRGTVDEYSARFLPGPIRPDFHVPERFGILRMGESRDLSYMTIRSPFEPLDRLPLFCLRLPELEVVRLSLG